MSGGNWCASRNPADDYESGRTHAELERIEADLVVTVDEVVAITTRLEAAGYISSECGLRLVATAAAAWGEIDMSRRRATLAMREAPAGDR